MRPTIAVVAACTSSAVPGPAEGRSHHQVPGGVDDKLGATAVVGTQDIGSGERGEVVFDDLRVKALLTCLLFGEAGCC